MEANETALTYLNQNKLLYLNMLEVLRRGSAELLYAGEDGVLLYDRGAEAHMLCFPPGTGAPWRSSSPSWSVAILWWVMRTGTGKS